MVPAQPVVFNPCHRHTTILHFAFCILHYLTDQWRYFMQTLFLSASDSKTPALAAELIRRGELVAIPTETVYGLGANGLDESAVIKIFEAKGRPQDNPLILHISGPEQMELFCHSIPEKASMQFLWCYYSELMFACQ